MKIALAQMNIIWEDKQENRLKCEAFISGAKSRKADLIVFPEMTLTGFSMNVENIGESSSCKETIEWFKRKALEFGMHIAFGYVGIEEKESENSENYKDGNYLDKCINDAKLSVKGKNNLCIVSPKGEEVVHYTKIHPFSFGGEDRFYLAGNDIVKARVGDFCVAPFICYDLRFPEVFQIASNNAQLIIVIANWPKMRREHWITLLKARAIENQCYVAGVNRVGIGDGIEYAGDSMVIDPNGEIISTATFEAGEEIIVADLDISVVEDIRRSFSMKGDRRKDLY